ncbi:hypothetical protein LJR219_003151 [Phenylobacterium sp. LjRoot219]|uniref:CC_3452 family protein n=1 Tax=Phenylobacterium sp. LjRoot219 TaxID=3342283 RepID=UPI003ECFCC6D
MKTRLSTLAAAAVLAAFATSAAAAPVVAKLQAPVAKRQKPIAGEAAFVCEADTCTAATPASGTNTVPGCRQLVRVVGPVSSYGVEGQALDADKLARCNAAAHK